MGSHQLFDAYMDQYARTRIRHTGKVAAIAGLIGVAVVLLLLAISLDSDRFIKQCMADGGTRSSCEVQYHAMINGKAVIVNQN